MSWVRVVQLLLSLSSSAQRVVLRLAVEALGDAGLDAVNAPPRIGEALCVKNKTKYIDDDMFTMVIIRHLTRAHTYRELIRGRGVGGGGMGIVERVKVRRHCSLSNDFSTHQDSEGTYPAAHRRWHSRPHYTDRGATVPQRS